MSGGGRGRKGVEGASNYNKWANIPVVAMPEIYFKISHCL